jgi:hypothetical protein
MSWRETQWLNERRDAYKSGDSHWQGAREREHRTREQISFHENMDLDLTWRGSSVVLK